jgi:putative ABC transport system permease protein
MLTRTIRRLLRQPSAPVLAVVTLALGLGISTALFTVTRDVVLRPFAFRDQERIVAIWASIPERSVPHLELTLAQHAYLRDHSKTLEQVAVMSAANFSVIVNTPDPVNVQSNFVTSSFYPLLGVKALHGRVFSADEHQPNAAPVALINERLWTSLFGGDPKLIGKVIDIDGTKATVVGVLPAEVNLPVGADLILPLEPFYNPPEAGRHNSVLEGLARMKPGATLEGVQAELNVMADAIEKTWPDSYKGTENHALPLVDELLGTTRPAMTTLFGMALLVLAISMFNAASIFIARAVARQRDTSIRVALGASRAALLREVLAETLVVSTVAAAIGFVLARAAVAALVRIGPATIPRLHEVTVRPSTYAFAALAAILVALVCALFASLRSGGLDGLRDGVERTHRARGCAARGRAGVARRRGAHGAQLPQHRPHRRRLQPRERRHGAASAAEHHLRGFREAEAILHRPRRAPRQGARHREGGGGAHAAAGDRAGMGLGAHRGRAGRRGAGQQSAGQPDLGHARLSRSDGHPAHPRPSHR